MACTRCSSEVECVNTTNWGRRILGCVAGFAFLLCVCQFIKTSMYRGDEMELKVHASNGHLNRQLLQDKDDNTRVSSKPHRPLGVVVKVILYSIPNEFETGQNSLFTAPF